MTDEEILEDWCGICDKPIKRGWVQYDKDLTMHPSCRKRIDGDYRK
jgi:hypothetical protein